MQDDEISALQDAWIGRHMSRIDTVSPRLIAQFRAMLSDSLFPAEVPLGLYWTLSPDALPPGDLGRDGHPRPGIYTPRLPLPRRMWAGGEVAFHAPLREGNVVQRDSTVDAISFKSGSTGRLGFVAVRHEYSVAGQMRISERQDLVYRPDPAPDAPQPAFPPAPDLGPPLAELAIEPNPLLLFRYSAMTFNGHRIHYDLPYATGVEGYADLVVHGPMQATFMLNLAAMVIGSCPSRFTYRGVSPLTLGHPIRIEAHPGPDGSILLRVRRNGGPVTMTGTAHP